MRHAFRTAFLILCLVSGGASWADDEAERLQLARELFIVSQQSANFDKIIPIVVNGMKPVVTRGDPKIEKDFDQIMPLFFAEFGKLKDRMIDDAARLHARAFTKAELEELVAFYKTPTGQKLARTQPELGQAMMALGQRYGQQVGTNLAEKMKAELRKRGHNI